MSDENTEVHYFGGPERRVCLEIIGGVATVRLDRPDKRNGLDLPMFTGLIAAGQALSGRRDVRAVVLYGAGESFCAGLDFQSFMSRGEAGQAAMLARDPDVSPANVAQRVGTIWQELPMPVIAAVYGHCYGGGLQIALGADIRLVHPDAKLSVMEIKWGIIPDMSITQTAARLVRPDMLRLLTWTGEVISGEYAVEIGLCTRVASDPLADAVALARQIAGKNPHAIRAAKSMYQRALGLEAPEALRLETDLQLTLLGSPNNMEAIMANFQKRAPKFSD